MTLVRNPIRQKAIDLVRDRMVEWNPSMGPSGGFTHLGGQRCDPALLIALWELRRASLVDVHGDVVALTVAGRSRLSEWGRGDPRA